MSPIRIAIIGGGIGGCTLANGLIKYDHIEFDLFEGSTAFKVEGIAVGLGTNAQSALKLISMDLYNSLQLAGGVWAPATRLMMGEGPNRDEFIFDLKAAQQVVHVHRALLLEQLLAPVPESRKHVNKKLESIDRSQEGHVTLRFKDGTSSQYHAVIGADGIRSTVRETVLAEHPDLIKPFFAGFWDMRYAVPVEVAKEAKILSPTNPEEIGWIGDGGFILHHLINNRETLGCIVAGIADEAYDGSNWRNPVTKEFLEKYLGDRGEFGESTIRVMLDQEEPFSFSQYESPKAPTFSNGRVCMMGDAAHGMTPWQGSGAGVTIEDALILERLLGKVVDPAQIGASLQAYDEVCRPRTQKAVETSRQAGIAMCGKDPVMGMDMKLLAEQLPKKWVHIYELDMEKHIDDALASFEKYQKAKH